MEIEISTSNQAQPIKPAPQITGIGARLKAARETMSLSEKEAAHRLHLSPKFISIIENEDFENGPPPTFIRGYVRSYARLLNFSEDDVANILEQLGMNTPPTVIIPPRLHSQPINDNNGDRYLHWVSYIVIAFLIASVGIWWATHSTNDSDTETKLPPKPIVAPAPTQHINTTPPPAAIPAPAANAAAAAPAPVSSTAATPATNVVTAPAAATSPKNTTSSAQAPVIQKAPETNVLQPAPQTEGPPTQPTVPDAPPPTQQAEPVPQPSVVPPMPNLSTTLTDTPVQTAPTNEPSQPHKTKHRHRSPTMRMSLPEPGLGFGDEAH